MFEWDFFCDFQTLWQCSLGKYFVMGLLLICWASWRASFTLLAFSNSFSALLSSWCESCEKIYLLWMSYSAVEHFFPLFAAENQIHSSYRQIIKMINFSQCFSPQKIVTFFTILFIIRVIGKNVVIRVSQLFFRNHLNFWKMEPNQVTWLLLTNMQTLENANFLSKWDIFGKLSAKSNVKWPN